MTVGRPVPRRTVIGTGLAAAAAAFLPVTGVTAAGVPAKLAIAFAGEDMTAVLLDSPPARDLAGMLPLDLTIEDYSTNEKIIRLPRKLAVEGSEPFGGEAPGDLCYYAPWGNLALFYAGYRWSEGLIRLGRLENWQAPLSRRGTFAVSLARRTA